MFPFPPRERDGFYQAIQDMWAECERSQAMNIPTLVVFGSMTDKTQSRTQLGRELIQTTADVEYHVLPHSAFVRCVWCGPADRTSYSHKTTNSQSDRILFEARVVLACEIGGASLYVRLESIMSGYALGTYRLLLNMVVNQILALITITRLPELDWRVTEDQQ